MPVWLGGCKGHSIQALLGLVVCKAYCHVHMHVFGLQQSVWSYMLQGCNRVLLVCLREIPNLQVSMQTLPTVSRSKTLVRKWAGSRSHEAEYKGLLEGQRSGYKFHKVWAAFIVSHVTRHVSRHTVTSYACIPCSCMHPAMFAIVQCSARSIQLYTPCIVRVAALWLESRSCI